MKKFQETIKSALIETRGILFKEADKLEGTMISNNILSSHFDSLLPEDVKAVFKPKLVINDLKKISGRTTLNSYVNNKHFKVEYGVFLPNPSDIHDILEMSDIEEARSAIKHIQTINDIGYYKQLSKTLKEVLIHVEENLSVYDKTDLEAVETKEADIEKLANYLNSIQ